MTSVITSYSIHYTKLYDNGKASWFACSVSWIDEMDSEADAFYEPKFIRYLLLTIQDITGLKEQQETIRINGLRALLAEQERVITSYSIHYTKLYEPCWAKRNTALPKVPARGLTIAKSPNRRRSHERLHAHYQGWPLG